MIDLPLVSLDLEILDSDYGSEIIEVGAVEFRGDETLDTFSALVVRRGRSRSASATWPGLTARDLARGEPLRDVLDRLSTFVGGATIVGQSIGLDLEHLKKARARPRPTAIRHVRAGCAAAARAEGVRPGLDCPRAGRGRRDPAPSAGGRRAGAAVFVALVERRRSCR